jgi:hypothetical protein
VPLLDDGFLVSHHLFHYITDGYQAFDLLLGDVPNSVADLSR